jgi:CRISPR system Cascade subunit CasE
MPYLSRIRLNPRRRESLRFLANPQRLHAAVLAGISRQPVTERALWRLEADSPYVHTLLVLTDSRPSWEHLLEQAGWSGAEEPQAETRSYDPLLSRVEPGHQFAFRVRANPVGATRHPNKPTASQREVLARERPRGVRVPHRTVGHQLTWFTDRVARWGFELVLTDAGVPDVRIVAREHLSFTKRSAGSNRRVILSTATFEGVLAVKDPETAVTSLLQGIGPARAYGCGLLTLAGTESGQAGPVGTDDVRAGESSAAVPAGREQN